MITRIPDGVKPRIVAATDANNNVFEAYVLRCEGRDLFIDVRMADFVEGGIAAIRNGIVPFHMIVCDSLV